MENTEKKHESELTFKTDINCAGCVAKVSPVLDQAPGICHWTIDTTSPDRRLVVHSEGITEAEVVRRVLDAGFNIEPIKP
ncbi:MAG: hypothetical protein KBA16_06195 [Bacteroidia bacterium]|nr:hypothetical protein [Bacteroidia bacterium]MBP7437294.1 hypothetical protein [Bacteroidia bacterium]MBP7728501.1 hypothetical protein [Bacteroidia bacterium]MBP7772452.1 hypothetical protein [Bacteroidia bacterium]